MASSYPWPSLVLNAKGIACPGCSRSFVQSFLPSSSRRHTIWSAGGRSSVASGSGRLWFCYCTRTLISQILLPQVPWDCRTNGSASGVAAGTVATSHSRIGPAQDGRLAFPPSEQSQVKAVACEIVAETNIPLSRQSTADVTRRVSLVLERPISRSTVWRILDGAAIKPWRFRHWIFPRDPDFAAKAQPILDLYSGFWYGEPLGDGDYILSSDEKTSIQARIRIHPSLPPEPGRAARLEFEYRRGGALQYLAAWDVRRGVVFGRTEAHTGIDPFMRLVRQVMSQEPYQSARRVFWIVDNGSSHRGETAQQRLQELYPNAILIHTPVHASWLNQVEIYFSLIQRKVLTPNDATSLDDIVNRLRAFEDLNNTNPRPFNWQFNRSRLEEFLRRLERHGFSSRPTRLAAA